MVVHQFVAHLFVVPVPLLLNIPGKTKASGLQFVECKIESHPSGDVLLGADCNIKEYVNGPSAIVVADESTFVKKCQGAYLNLDVPELQRMRESWLCTHLGLLRQLHGRT